MDSLILTISNLIPGQAITNVTVNGLPLTTTGLPLPDGASVVFDNRLAFIFKTNYQEYIMQLNRAWARVSEQFAPEIGRLGPYEVEISYVRQLLATSNLNVHLVQLLRRMQYATDLRQMFDQIRCMLCGGHTIDKTFLLPCGKVVGFKCAKMCFLGGRCIGCCMPVVEVPALLRQMSGFIDDFVQRRRHVLGPIANNCCRLRSRTLPGEAIATRTVMAPMPGQRKRNNSF